MSGPFSAPPQPDGLASAAEFVAALRRLRQWSGLTYRQLTAAAKASGDVLPSSTIAGALGRTTLPREEFVAAFVRACGLGEAETARWVAHRKRLAAGMVPPADPHDTAVGRNRPTGPPEKPRPDVRRDEAGSADPGGLGERDQADHTVQAGTARQADSTARADPTGRTGPAARAHSTRQAERARRADPSAPTDPAGQADSPGDASPGAQAGPRAQADIAGQADSTGEAGPRAQADIAGEVDPTAQTDPAAPAGAGDPPGPDAAAVRLGTRALRRLTVAGAVAAVLLLATGAVLAQLRISWAGGDARPSAAPEEHHTPPATSLAVPTAGSKRPPRDGWYHIVPLHVADRDLCLGEGRERNGRTDRPLAVQRPCQDLVPDTYLRAAGGAYEIQWHHPKEGVGCLTVDEALRGPGALVAPENCTGARHQRFVLVPAGAGFALRPLHSGLCLGALYGEPDVVPGAELAQQSCTGQRDQVFLFRPVPVPPWTRAHRTSADRASHALFPAGVTKRGTAQPVPA